MKVKRVLKIIQLYYELGGKEIIEKLFKRSNVTPTEKAEILELLEISEL